MVLRPFLNDAGSCASYLLGCTTGDAEAFADALLADVPPRPGDRDQIVAANRAGTVGAAA